MPLGHGALEEMLDPASLTRVCDPVLQAGTRQLDPNYPAWTCCLGQKEAGGRVLEGSDTLTLSVAWLLALATQESTLVIGSREEPRGPPTRPGRTDPGALRRPPPVQGARQEPQLGLGTVVWEGCPATLPGTLGPSGGSRSAATQSEAAGAGGGSGAPPVRPPGRGSLLPGSVGRSEGHQKPRSATLRSFAGGWGLPRAGIGCEGTGWARAGDPRSPGSPLGRRAAHSADAAGARPAGPQQRPGGLADGTEEAATATVAPAGAGRAKMFDSSQYPYNCFNYDADDYPVGSSDEQKRLTRPAYR